MADIWPTWKRSQVMASIRGKGNRSTELRLINLFKVAGLRGWRRHLPLPGKPDFAFSKVKLVIFTDGDFWHGRITRRPKSNQTYWIRKIDGNRRRDRINSRRLRNLGWSVIRLWESDLKHRPEFCINRIVRKLVELGQKKTPLK